MIYFFCRNFSNLSLSSTLLVSFFWLFQSRRNWLVSLAAIRFHMRQPNCVLIGSNTSCYLYWPLISGNFSVDFIVIKNMHNFDILNSFAIFPITWGKNCSVDAVHDHEFLPCMFLILQVLVFPGKCLYGLWAELHEKFIRDNKMSEKRNLHFSAPEDLVLWANWRLLFLVCLLPSFVLPTHIQELINTLCSHKFWSMAPYKQISWESRLKILISSERYPRR